MITAKEIISLSPGGAEFEKLETAAKSGDKTALKLFVYYSAWREILKDKFIPAKKRLQTLRALLAEDLIEVNFGV